ncbi:hypothetical protein OB919_08045 [Halobacteria archaeon AArc-curdl1]|uniref:Uncharacterized protein n=1 Tax=Natronosalvus hydrolyticus TaxID=2979988 RepID=A0AAP3E5U3_9EURY|nr:hypothetical protein [Halobacteria archaeon AArc-curdl1]
MSKELESVFGIDTNRFNQTFAEYWQENDSSENRVHVETTVESEVINAVDEWSNRLYEEAQAGNPDTGLFLIIEGAQATGKTTMTRYIRDQLDPVENESRQNVPIVLPIWQKSLPNPSSYKYLQRIQSEGKQYLNSIDNVPDLEYKLQLIDTISTQLSDEELSSFTDGADISGDQFREIAEEAGLFDGQTEPSDVISKLADQGYMFVFIFDEMVPSHRKEEAQNVLKWFEKHLNPYVGFVLFCHPDVSSITRNDMFDQMRRRNGDITLDIAGNQHRLDQNHVINIRGRQDQLINLRELLTEYFQDVYLDEQDEEYGPFTDANVEWMESLLRTHGLIGNLIDGVGTAIKRYANDATTSNEYGGIGAYLYDECDRAMKSARLKVAFKAVTDLDPDDRTAEVAASKELIVGSRNIDELSDNVRDSLLDNRVIFEDENELKIHPKLLDPDFGSSSPDSSSESRERLIDEYLRKAEEFETKLEEEDRDDLRYATEDYLINVIEWFGTQRANVTDQTTLSVPGIENPGFGVTSFSREESLGRARKLKPESGGLEEYEGEYLIFALFEDEALSDSDVENQIRDLYGRDHPDSGILVFTDKPQNDWADPDWFNEEISTHRQWTPDYTWGDIIQRVSISDIQEPWTIGRIAENRDYDTVVERIQAIQTLSEDHLAPDLYENLWGLTSDLHESVIELHVTTYKKYNGPTLPEAEALSKVLDIIKEQGFVTKIDLLDIRSEYRNELKSLIETGGLKEIEGTEDTFVFFDSDYGGISYLTDRSIDDLRDLRPIPKPVLEELQSIAEMQNDLQWVHQDDDIDQALSELEDAEKLINYFLTEDSEIDRIESELNGITALSNVADELESVRCDFNIDGYSRIQSLLEEDRMIWDEIQQLPNSDISDIHRTLFYSRLVENPPQGAGEYLDEDELYPSLFHETESDIRYALKELQDSEQTKVEEYNNQTESLQRKRKKVRSFIHNGGDSDE